MERDLLLRLGRWLTWGSPALYRPIGWLRRRENYRLCDYDAWVGGYPRSSNTYTALALESHLPGWRVVSHVHLPPPIIQAVREDKPGLFVIRRPAGAVTSWVQYSSFSLAHCLHYYCDFHRALLPYVDRLLVVRFERTTGEFESVLQRFTARFGVAVQPVSDKDHISGRIEDMWRNEDGTVNEAQVARPSAHRRAGRAALMKELQADPSLQRALRKAEALYAAFTAGLPPLPPHLLDRDHGHQVEPAASQNPRQPAEALNGARPSRATASAEPAAPFTTQDMSAGR